MTFFDVFRLSGVWTSVERPFARLVEEGVGEEGGGGGGGGGVLSLVLDCLFNLSHVYLRLSSFLQRKRVLGSLSFISSSLPSSSLSLTGRGVGGGEGGGWLCSGLCSVNHIISSPDCYPFYAHTTTPDVVDIKGYPEMVLGHQLMSKIGFQMVSDGVSLVSPLEAYYGLKKEWGEGEEEEEGEEEQEKRLSDHLRKGCDTLLATLYNYIYTFLEKKQLEQGVGVGVGVGVGQTGEKREGGGGGGGEGGGEREGEGVFPSLPEVVVMGSVHSFGGEGLVESRRAQSCLVTLFHIAHGHAKVFLVLLLL